MNGSIKQYEIFVALVDIMRDAQRKYFEDRKISSLREAGELEKAVDDMTFNFINNLPTPEVEQK